MNTVRFERLTRLLTPAKAPRRQALGALLLGSITSRLGGVDGEARKRKKRKKKCKGGTKKCGKRCLDLATDGDNCGACGHDCISAECERGVCLCEAQIDCPLTCYCVGRKQGGGACIGIGEFGAACATDDDCPLRSICFSNNRCSLPCVV